jgi:hypothetical protein
VQLTRNQLLTLGVLFFTFLAGILFTRWFYNRSEEIRREKATVLLERIQQVTKLITVEGHFTEIYDYKDYYGYDIGMFRKKALMRVQAKVSAGYDLGKMKIQSFPQKKQVVISGLPEPEILSIEHDLDYYDLQEGIFNSFSTEDYNRLNADAKNKIRQKALQSDLFEAASEQRDKVFDMIRFMVESAGWTLEIDGWEDPEKPENFEN